MPEGHQPHGLEPDRQRRSRLVKECPRGRRNAFAAFPAPIPPGLLDRTEALAARALEPLGPSKPVPVVKTGLVIGKPGAHPGKVGRIILPRNWHNGRLDNDVHPFLVSVHAPGCWRSAGVLDVMSAYRNPWAPKWIPLSPQNIHHDTRVHNISRGFALHGELDEPHLLVLRSKETKKTKTSKKLT